MNADLLVAGPHIGLGVTLRLAAHPEYAFGKWPSLVADTGLLTFQIDLHPDLTDDQAREVVHDLAAAVAEWEVAIGTRNGLGTSS
jgi:hypothetical protein